MSQSLRQQIIEQMKVKSVIDPEAEIRRSIEFMKDYARQHTFLKAFVLGISGGQDSTLLGKLAQLAVEELREEMMYDQSEMQFIAVRLPYGEQRDEADAQAVLDWIQPDRCVTVDIKPSVDALVHVLAQQNIAMSDFNKGNIKARERMVAQYAIAGEYAGVVLGTDHSAENITGFFTKHGDGASDINPLFRLNKRQGAQLLEVLGAPELFYKKTPTADLEDDKPGLADSEKLGVNYEAIDDYLEGREVSAEDQATIESWYLKTEHKRHLPITVFDDFYKKMNK